MGAWQSLRSGGRRPVTKVQEVDTGAGNGSEVEVHIETEPTGAHSAHSRAFCSPLRWRKAQALPARLPLTWDFIYSKRLQVASV